MRILVTGGIGVNGSWVTRKLLQRGHEPVVFENRADLSLVQDIAGQFPLVSGDVRDVDALVDACRTHRVECIVHLAALMPPDSQANLLRGFEVNALGSVTVFEAARLAGVRRVVYSSSKSAYGAIPDGEHAHPHYRPVPETHPCDPVIAYDIGKLAPEYMGRNYASDHGLEFTALRYGTIFGPGKLARHGEMSIFCAIVENAVDGRPTRIPLGGDQVDDLMYVDDAAEGTVLAALAPTLPHPVYNIASGVGTSLLDFGATVRSVLPSADIEIGPGLDYLGMGINFYSVSDISRAGRELGYAPRFTLREGIEHYVSTLGRLRAETV